MSLLKEKLYSGKPVIGTWINSGSPIVAETIAQFGFDYLCVDVEHSAVDLPQVQQIFQGIRSGNPHCAQFVRLHGVDYTLVKRYLDAGANGLIAPLVNSREDAELLIRSAKYPPMGKRGLGFCRANKYGTETMVEFDRANETGVIAVQIEDIKAVDNLDAILDVKGIDIAFIGPYDLSASMGLTAQFDHPDYLAARNHILKACERHGVYPGLHVVQPDPDEVVARLEEGYRVIAFSLDITMLTHVCGTAMERILKAIH
ncbi:MAG: hypothetical protein JJT75_04020 [Opitutales bacterium]|nr:hypothetical protein [Opitutales bacterium]MCH8539403.1 hypothetical protein [Opitutales bacterium]